ncbi:reverse transcriptase domain-containing protein [Tanacetum coccineum]
MAPKKRTMRLNPETTPAATAATTTTVTNAQLQTMINQGVTAALAARDANTNGWNSHVRTVGNDITYAMTWAELKKKMTDKYCPRTEIKKLEVELWELKVKESDKIEKYVGGLPDMIHGSVVASKPKTMQDTTEMATKVMDKRIRTFADRQTENKRKQDDNQHQQQQKGKTPAGRTLQGLVTERSMLELFHCATGHYRSDFPELKNQNHGNQAEGTGAR